MYMYIQTIMSTEPLYSATYVYRSIISSPLCIQVHYIWPFMSTEPLYSVIFLGHGLLNVIIYRVYCLHDHDHDHDNDNDNEKYALMTSFNFVYYGLGHDK